MRNAVRPHISAVLAVGSTLGYCCYDLRPIYDTKKSRTGEMERNEVPPPVSHVVVNIPCSKNKNMVPGIYLRNIFGVLLEYENVKNNTNPYS